MRTRRAHPEDLEAIGEVTVAAYAEFEGDDTDEYVHHLRDAATRDREAELWVATPDDSEDILGTVTICPPGSPWREIAREGEGEFRMLAVAPAARGAGIGAAIDRAFASNVPYLVNVITDVNAAYPRNTLGI